MNNDIIITMSDFNNTEKELTNWIDGVERYLSGEDIILQSSSWEDAKEMARKHIEKRKAGPLLNNDFFYFDSNGEIMWQEYQFLFLCQYIEFKLAEYIFTLFKKNKVNPEYLEELKKNKKINTERALSPERMLSPASLIIDLGYSLGGLIEIIKEKTIDFDTKQDILIELDKFNSDRISFVHHAFTSNKKTDSKTMKEIMSDGKNTGLKIITILNATYLI